MRKESGRDFTAAEVAPPSMRVPEAGGEAAGERASTCGTADGRSGVMGRRALMLGAVGATTVLTVRPALAQSAGSVMQCRIQVPEPAKAGQFIAADGSVVPAGTQGAFAGRTLQGRDVAQALKGSILPGTTAEQSSAYIKYVQRLQAGQPGFSCYASLRVIR